MRQIDPEKFAAGAIQELVDRVLDDEWSRFLTAAPPSHSSESRLDEKTLLEIAESLPPGEAISMLGLKVIVSPYVPTEEDRLRLDERSVFRRMFTRNLCGVHAETVPCAHIFLVDIDGQSDRRAVVSSATAALLKFRPPVII